MTYRSEAKRRIDVPAEALWSTISSVSGMEKWYPGLIAQSSVEQTRSGVRRHCTMTGGGELHERILVCDDQTMTLVYSVDQHPLPARNVVGIIRVDSEAGASTVRWSALFSCDSQHADQTVSVINKMYADGLLSLDQYHH